ncbi:MAG: hypothetical protein ACRCSK_02335 [Fusobacteriaceae bacterium]
MWETIRQLHRIFIDIKSTPFEGESIIFKKDKSDNLYFKDIRAVFGTHSTNLEIGGKKCFASWSTPRKIETDKYDYEVDLYNAKIKNDDMILGKFGFNFCDIDLFLGSRYGYLKKIIKEIKNKHNIFIEEFQTKKIQKNSDLLSQLKILEKEAEERLLSDNISDIKKLIEIFSTKITDEKNDVITKKYRNETQKFIPSIINNFLKMNYCKIWEKLLNSFDDTNWNSLFADDWYTKSQGEGHLRRQAKELAKTLENYVFIDSEKMEISEIRALARIGMHYYAKEIKSKKKKL